MRNRIILVAIVGVGVAVFAALAWWLAAPLFITDTVDEDFPSAEQFVNMSEAERADLADEIEAMPEEQRETFATAVLEESAEMPDKVMEETMPQESSEPVVLAVGEFVDADNFHQGSGTATIYQLADGSRVLRFENFEITNGPDLHVLLATSSQASSRDDLGDYIDLGSLKGNVGNQNYDIPADADLSLYNSVVIYCVPFHVVFSTATLSGG